MRMGSRPSQFIAASRTWSKMRMRTGLASAISMTVPGVPFIEKIDERAARSVTLLADLPTGCQRALADLMIVHRPALPMLHPLVAGGEEVPVKARHIVALLNQLELHIA